MIIYWRILFVFCPLFWKRLWTEDDSDSFWFKCWLTFVIGLVIVLIVGLAAGLIWMWPPIALLYTGVIVGTWIGSSRWWSKINQ